MLLAALVIFFALQMSEMATTVGGAGDVIAAGILEAIAKLPYQVGGVLDVRMNNRWQTTIEYLLVAVLVILGIIFAFRGAEIWDAISVAAGNINTSMIVGE